MWQVTRRELDLAMMLVTAGTFGVLLSHASTLNRYDFPEGFWAISMTAIGAGIGVVFHRIMLGALLGVGVAMFFMDLAKLGSH